MDKDLEQLLGDAALEPPDDFTRQVMQRVWNLPPPARRASWQTRLQQLALILGGIAGAAQLAGFMFGVWAASSAG
ncbi:hypothetical protein AAKU55_003946 [Oxalobacteraceae bacterium GrIS 1.11]